MELSADMARCVNHDCPIRHGCLRYAGEHPEGNYRCVMFMGQGGEDCPDLIPYNNEADS